MAGKKSRNFYKNYPNRKDKRKPYFGYQGTKLAATHDAMKDPDANKRGCPDPTCRPGCDCPWCSKGRRHKIKRQEPLDNGQEP